MKIGPHPQGIVQRPKATAKPWRKQKRSPFRRLQVVIEYRGGPQCSYLVQADGRTWRYDGFLALHDVMTHFWNDVH